MRQKFFKTYKNDLKENNTATNCGFQEQDDMTIGFVVQNITDRLRWHAYCEADLCKSDYQ